MQDYSNYTYKLLIGRINRFLSQEAIRFQIFSAKEMTGETHRLTCV